MTESGIDRGIKTAIIVMITDTIIKEAIV